MDTSLSISEIVVRPDSSSAKLAALELRRYWYARTGQTVQADCNDGHRVVLCTVATGEAYPEMLARARSLGPESAVIHTSVGAEQSELVVMGTDDAGLLYGAYRVCEHWGVYFHLHGDTLPDEPLREWPMIDEDREPLFAQRGIHPFHNFPEGPDAWDTETYRLHLAQLAKMGMNFIGFHSYTPKDRPFEPQVWIGLPDAVGEGGEVTTAYAAETWHPRCGAWNYHPIEDLSVLPLEMERLVPADAYADHADAERAAELFRRIGERWADVFGFASKRGVRTCLGLEIPLLLPPTVVAELESRGFSADSDEAIREVFIGIFSRIEQTHPLDLFWLYVPEDWVWLQAVDAESVARTVHCVKLAQEALEASRASFKLGVCGWIVGPQNDPLALERGLPEGISLAALTGKVGHLPISPYYKDVTKRQGWAIPWFEDDPRLSVPQLWAGRMLRDAADAHALGCEGLLGIHWRTRCLAPQMAAMARSAWDQSDWNSEFGMRFTDEDLAESLASEGQTGGAQVAWSAPQEPLDTTLPVEIFATATSGAPYYYISVPAGRYRVRCYLVETDRKIRPGARRMSISINSESVLDKADLVAQYGHDNVIVVESSEHVIEDGENIDIYLRQVIGDPILAAVEVEGHTSGFNQFEGVPYARRINCGGPLVADPSGDWEAGKVMSGRMQERPRFFDSSVFYAQWAGAEFGPSVGPRAAEIFARIDGKLPCITYMWAGPGNCTADETPWEQVAKDYTFVDELDALRALPMGASERDRFDYWYHHLAAFRAAAKLRCCVAHPEALSEIQDAWRALYMHLLESVRSHGDLGTLFTVEQQWRMDNLKEPVVQLDEPYTGAARIVVMTLPSNVSSAGQFKLCAQVIGAPAPAELTFEYRSAESNDWQSVAMPRHDLASYSVCMPAGELPEIFAYRVRGTLNGSDTAYPHGQCVGGVTCVVESI